MAAGVFGDSHRDAAGGVEDEAETQSVHDLKPD
jgi:hypothetical protein